MVIPPYTQRSLRIFPAVLRIQHEYKSTIAHNGTVWASSSDEVGDVLRDLVPAPSLVKWCQARAGTELVDVEVTTGNERRENNTMYARISLRALIDMLDGSNVIIEHVVRVPHGMTTRAREHVVVFRVRTFSPSLAFAVCCNMACHADITCSDAVGSRVPI